MAEPHLPSIFCRLDPNAARFNAIRLDLLPTEAADTKEHLRGGVVHARYSTAHEKARHEVRAMVD
jgi:hypothetical protein